MKNTFISIIGLIVSVIAIGFSLLRIVPFVITSETYLGIIATFIGIAVTMLIGYQIVNTLEIKREILEQRKLTNKLQYMNDVLNKTIKTQKNEMQEGFDIISTLVYYQENGWTYSIQAFTSLHKALIASLETERTEYDWIFNLLRKYIMDINWENFTKFITSLSDGRYMCNVDGNPTNNKELKDIIKEYTDVVYDHDRQIRDNCNFCRIKMEYNRVMALFNNRIKAILANPNNPISEGEKSDILYK